MSSGHYFCSFCNDVKFVRFTERYEVCPDCHHRSMTWVTHPVRRRTGRVAVDFERGKALFARLHQDIMAAERNPNAS